VPTGKTQIIARRAWTITLSNLIWHESQLKKLETRSAPWDDCSDEERNEKIASTLHFLELAPRYRVSYAINIRSLKPFIKQNTRKPTRDELKNLRGELREAVKFYQLDRAESLSTPTQRRKQLTKVKTAAAHLVAKRRKGWAKRLAQAIRNAQTDKGAEMLLRKVLARGTGERFGRLAALLGELDAAASLPEGTVLRGDEFATDWLEVLAKLEVEALVPAGTRWPDPGLAPLVARLAPIWCRVTGRTAGPVLDKVPLRRVVRGLA
jgi:hypothetical protein